MVCDKIFPKSERPAKMSNLLIQANSVALPKDGINILQNIVLQSSEGPSTSGEGGYTTENDSIQPACVGSEQRIGESSELNVPLMSLEDNFDPSEFDYLISILDSNTEVCDRVEASSSHAVGEVNETSENVTLNGKRSEVQCSTSKSEKVHTKPVKRAVQKARTKNVGSSTLKSLLIGQDSAPAKRRKVTSQNKKTYVAGNVTLEAGCSNASLSAPHVVHILGESDTDSDIEIFSQAEDRELIKIYARKRNELEKEFQLQLMDVRNNEASLKTANANIQSINNQLHRFGERRKCIAEGRKHIEQERQRLHEEERCFDQEECYYNSLSLEDDVRQLQTTIEHNSGKIQEGRVIMDKLSKKIEYFRRKTR